MLCFTWSFPNKVRVISIPDCLDSAAVDISKDDCSARDNVRAVGRDLRYHIYSKAVLVRFKTEESRLLPIIYTRHIAIAPFTGICLAIVWKGREFNVIKIQENKKKQGFSTFSCVSALVECRRLSTFLLFQKKKFFSEKFFVPFPHNVFSMSP